MHVTADLISRLEYAVACSDEAMSPVKATYIWCLHYGQQMAFTGIWLHHNIVAAILGKVHTLAGMNNWCVGKFKSFCGNILRFVRA